jgi:acyl-CoA thioesterase FadM
MRSQLREVRYASVVTQEDAEPALPDVEPTAPGYGTHLPFHLILQRCAVAWRSFLRETHGFEEGADGVIVPRVSADFLAEVRLGSVEIGVTVVEVRTTSFRVRCDVVQDDKVCARVDVVLVRFDYDGGSAVPLSPRQREGLARTHE